MFKETPGITHRPSASRSSISAGGGVANALCSCEVGLAEVHLANSAKSIDQG